MSKTIALAMIVKNEESLLERALKSCEWIQHKFILDTGSVDRTVEIARENNCHVDLSYVWTDSFCDAQNYLLQKIREKVDETGPIDFILSLDADEQVLSSREEIENAINQTKDVLRVQMVAEGGDEDKNDFGFGRIFRNTPDIFWCQPIHKHLNVPGEGEPIGNIKIMYGYSPAHRLDPNRSLRMLEKAVSDNPFESRNLYYLGREYLYKQRYQDCINTLQKYVKISEWPAEKAEAYLEMGQAYSFQGMYQEAADCYLFALKINANFKEAAIELSRIVTSENAIQWKRMAKFANNRDVLWNRIPVEPASDIIFIEPHQDDAVLYGFYTLIREKPLLISVTSSFIQPERGEAGCDAETRNKETIEAAKIAGCPIVFLNIRDTELTEEILRERLIGFNPEKVYIPAQHENGNSHHNLIGKVALEIFGHDKCEQYCTYVRGDFNIVKGSWEVKPVHNEAELKNKALDCFKSQLALPSTAPHFEAVRNKSEYLL